MIIDEAAQALDADVIMPLIAMSPGQQGPGICIVVGDSRQLPPFMPLNFGEKVICNGALCRVSDHMAWASAAGSGESANCVRLKTQRRMHKAIASFPSQNFYAGFAESSDYVEKSKAIFMKGRHLDRDHRRGPVAFLGARNLLDKTEKFSSRNASWRNDCELDIIKSLIEFMMGACKEATSSNWITVVTPCRAQLDAVSAMITAAQKKSSLRSMAKASAML